MVRPHPVAQMRAGRKAEDGTVSLAVEPEKTYRRAAAWRNTVCARRSARSPPPAPWRAGPRSGPTGPVRFDRAVGLAVEGARVAADCIYSSRRTISKSMWLTISIVAFGTTTPPLGQVGA